MQKRSIHGSQTGVHEIELKPKSEELDSVAYDLENPPVVKAAVEQQKKQSMSASGFESGSESE